MTDSSSQGHDQSIRSDLEQATTPAAPEPRFDLEYPEIPLHLSLESLLAHSSSSSSCSTVSVMPPPEAGQRSLDDSWASLVGDESFSEDDIQSEHTDVGSLLDVHSSDDVRSTADGNNINDVDFTDEEDLRDNLTEELGREDILGPQVWTESSSLCSTAEQSRCLQHNYSPEVGSPSGTKHTIGRQLTEAEAQKLPLLYTKGLESAQYFSVVQMPTFEDGVDLNTYNYFKVLLLGRHIEQFRPELQRKLGDTLVSQTATSAHPHPTSLTRFHLVPNSFGPGAEPDFADLVAIDKQIDFDCYDMISSTNTNAGPSELVLSNSLTGTKITSTSNGSEFVVPTPRWTLPDLAIICVHLNEDNVMDEESCNMLAFVERHALPHVLLRMNRGWGGDYTRAALNDSLYETIEIQHNELTWKASPKLPVDIAAFLNLEATQLNKHLAFVLPATNARSARQLGDSAFNAKEKAASIFDNIPQLNASLLKNAFMILWVVGVYTFLGYHLWPIWSDPILGANSRDVTGNIGTEPTMSHTLTQGPCIVSSTLVKEVQATYPVVDMSAMTVVNNLAKDATRFQISVTGDRQLLVKLPKVALDRKKRSQLVVEVRRQNETIAVEIQELLEGVFSVQLQPHDAYGDIAVNLQMRKPQLRETLTISFGDRVISPTQRVLIMWDILHGKIREATDVVSGYVGWVLKDIELGQLQEFSHDLTERLPGRRCLWNHLMSSTRPQVNLHEKFQGSLDAVRRRFAQQAENSTKQSKTLVDAMAARYSAARIAARTCFSELTQARTLMRCRLKTKGAPLRAKLEAVRARASGIVSGVVQKLRALKAGR